MLRSLVPTDRELGGPHSSSGSFGKYEIRFPVPAIESRSFDRSALGLVTISTDLFRLHETVPCLDSVTVMIPGK